MTARDAAARNIGAEARFVEEGHRVYLVDDHAEVVSDSLDRVRYELRAIGIGDLAVFSCTCPATKRHAPRGVTPCKHAAGLARRMERLGLLQWGWDGDGLWHVTDKARDLGMVAAPFDNSGDPPTAVTSRGRTVGAASTTTDPDQLAAQLRAAWD